jgi:hypothetical protein
VPRHFIFLTFSIIFLTAACSEDATTVPPREVFRAITASPTATPTVSSTPTQVVTPIATVTPTHTPSPTPTARPLITSTKESVNTDSPKPPWIPWGTNARPGAVIAAVFMGEGWYWASFLGTTRADELGQWFFRLDKLLIRGMEEDSVVSFIEHTGRKATAQFDRAESTEVTFGDNSIREDFEHPTFIAWGTDAPPFAWIWGPGKCGRTSANESGEWLMVHNTNTVPCRAFLSEISKYIDINSLYRNVIEGYPERYAPYRLDSPLTEYGPYRPDGNTQIFFTGLRTEFFDGSYRVGVDVPYGTYQNSPGGYCEITVNGSKLLYGLAGRMPLLITIDSSWQDFRVYKCGHWTKVIPTSASPETQGGK